MMKIPTEIIAFALLGLIIGIGVGSFRYYQSKQKSAYPQLPAQVYSKILMKTNFGEIKIGLYDKHAPITVANFLEYVEEGFYAGTVFHRIINGFMIQGGGFDESLQQKPTKAPIKNEADNLVKNARGTIAMARTGVVDSATAQFFINVVDNNSLDFRSADRAGFGYCVFGEVIEGMQIVDMIKELPVQPKGMHQHFPRQEVVIESVEIL